MCEGTCNGWLNRVCAGLTKAAIEEYESPQIVFYVTFCSQVEVRSSHDVKEVYKVLSIVDADLPERSICDSVHLDKYNQSKSRPIQVRLSHSFKVLSVLRNRRNQYV